ncbi:sensor histidine kinase [Streptomyces sp. NPDC004111]|uniref:sensor histidine kinase n=1 Tax=Streptomyces sp. NPDC004111 TaxID=3364690 RepID=UPI0036B0678F
MKGFWRGRSKAAKLDLYMRITLYALPWLLLLGVMAPFASDLVREPGAIAMAQGLLALAFVMTLLSMHAINRGIAHHRHGSPAPWRTAVLSLVLGAMFTALAVTLQVTGGLGAKDNDGSGLSLTLWFGLSPVVMCVYALSTVRRLFLLTLAASVLAGAVVQVVTGDGPTAVITGVGVVLSGVYGLGAYRSSLWFIATIWELDKAQRIQARLAVAEERLRFGRDLHDVMGRNLAVIALKSELAVQLAERGRPEAVAQMAEVQRIAQESQREVRAVVRGYREADLRNEIEGARGVLAAAGISCVVEDRLAAELPAAVQSALGWVVRETTTNVLRHGNPKQCTLRLFSDGDRAVLVVENDGTTADGGVASSGTPGSGLAGLRERLASVGGTLVAGATDTGRFRVTAEVPLTAADGPSGNGEREVGLMDPESPERPGPERKGKGRPGASEGTAAFGSLLGGRFLGGGLPGARFFRRSARTGADAG